MSERAFATFGDLYGWIADETNVQLGHVNAFFLWKNNVREYTTSTDAHSAIGPYCRLKIPIAEFAEVIQAWDAEARLRG